MRFASIESGIAVNARSVTVLWSRRACREIEVCRWEWSGSIWSRRLKAEVSAAGANLSELGVFCLRKASCSLKRGSGTTSVATQADDEDYLPTFTGT